MLEKTTNSNYIFKINGKIWRFLCAKLGFTSKELAVELGYVSGRIDGILARRRLTSRTIASLVHIYNYHHLDFVDVLKEASYALTLAEFARECQVSKVTVSRWVQKGTVKTLTDYPYKFVHLYEVCNYWSKKHKFPVELILP